MAAFRSATVRALLCGGSSQGGGSKGTHALSALVCSTLRCGATPLSRRIHSWRLRACTGASQTMVAHVAFLPPDLWTCSAFALHGSTFANVVGLTVFCDALCALAANLCFTLARMLEVLRSTRRRRIGTTHGTLRHDGWARTPCARNLRRGFGHPKGGETLRHSATAEGV